MSTASASGRYSPRQNPPSASLPRDSISLLTIPLLAVRLRTLRRLRRLRL